METLIRNGRTSLVIDNDAVRALSEAIQDLETRDASLAENMTTVLHILVATIDDGLAEIRQQ